MDYLNLDSILQQLAEHDLTDGKNPITRLDFNQRKRVDWAGKKKGGFYYAYDDKQVEDKAAPGFRKILITGYYGHFEGADIVLHNFAVAKGDWAEIKRSPQEKAEADRLRKEHKKQDEAEQKAKWERAAQQAQFVWHHSRRQVNAHYLDDKLIRAQDVRQTPADWPERIGEWPKDLFKFDKPDPSNGKNQLFDLPPPEQAIVVPYQDVDGNIHALQFILDKTVHKDWIQKHEGNNKQNWPAGCALKGRFFHIGGIVTDLFLLCEGWATGMSLHQATGLPVIVAFSAGNIAAVLEELLPYYPKAKALICADDDDLYACGHCGEKIQLSKIAGENCPHCGQPHKKTNAGVKAAMKACTSERVRYVRPQWPETIDRLELYRKNKGKLTDFNDLHKVSSLTAIRKQIEAALSCDTWLGGAGSVMQTEGGGGGHFRIDTTAQALARFSLIYAQKGTVFDHKHRLLMSKDDMRDVCTRATMDQWQHSPHRRTYLVEQVGFDPTGRDVRVVCNMWKGWPTTPKEGDCDLILDLLKFLCSGEDNADEIYEYLLKWYAYPIQNPGAKMPVAIVMHGGQGCGKNLFNEIVMAIYGDYGAVIDQDCLEDKYNDFFSQKLFLIADEVIGRSDRYHVVNKLKVMITGKDIRINPKNIASHKERNHINTVFLANGLTPLVLEQDDRRHLVIWVPEKRDKAYYNKVVSQSEKGGIAALHHYLLNAVDCTGFGPHVPVPMTQAKTDLIALNKEAFALFYDALLAREIGNVPLVPFMLEDGWALFKKWCQEEGEKPGKKKYFNAGLNKAKGMDKQERQWVRLSGQNRVQRTFFWPPGCEQREGLEMMDWLGKCVDRFQAAVKDYAGGKGRYEDYDDGEY